MSVQPARPTRTFVRSNVVKFTEEEVRNDDLCYSNVRLVSLGNRNFLRLKGLLVSDIPLHQCLFEMLTEILFVLVQSYQCFIHVELLSFVGTKIKLQFFELLIGQLLPDDLDEGLVFPEVEFVEVGKIELLHRLKVVSIVIEFVELIRCFECFIEEGKAVLQHRDSYAFRMVEQLVDDHLNVTIKVVDILQIDFKQVQDYLQFLIVSTQFVEIYLGLDDEVNQVESFEAVD